VNVVNGAVGGGLCASSMVIEMLPFGEREGSRKRNGQLNCVPALSELIRY